MPYAFTRRTDGSTQTIFAAHVNELQQALEDNARRPATLVVAFADSSTKSKQAADYVCTGTADQTTLNAALAALPAAGGRVVLLEGSAALTAPVVVPNAAVHLVGQGGKATLLKAGSGQTTPVLRVLGPTGRSTYGVTLQRVAHLGIDGGLGSGTAAHGLEIAGANYQGLYEHLHVTGCKGHSVYLHSVNTTQAVVTYGTITGGTFTITLGGQTTAAIAYNATAAQVASAVAALTNVGTGNVTGSGGPLGVSGVESQVNLAFTGGSVYSLTMPQMTVTSSITGGGGVFIGPGERPAYNRIAWCNIENGAVDGIHIGDAFPAGTYAEHNEVLHCSITFHTGKGLYTTGNNQRVHSNQFDYLGYGYYAEGCENNAVWGNTFDRCNTAAVFVTQGGLHTFGFNLLGDRRDGWSATARMVSLGGSTSGNKFVGNSALKTGDVRGTGSGTPGTGWAYGFGEDAGCGQNGTGYWGPNVYVGNGMSWMQHQFSGNRPVLLGNSGSDLTGTNTGPFTRNSGTATITAATSVTVTHGLGFTPTRVFLTPTTSVAQTLAVTAKTSTTFTVTASASTTVTFDWACQAGDG